MSHWPQVRQQLDWLTKSLQHLKSRVQTAIAGEISRLFSQTVQEVLQLVFEPPTRRKVWQDEPDDSWPDDDVDDDEEPASLVPPSSKSQPSASLGSRLLEAVSSTIKSYSPARPFWWSVGLALGATVTALSPDPIWQGVNSVLLSLSELFPAF